MIYFSGNCYLCDVDVVLIVSDKCCLGSVGANLDIPLFWLSNLIFGGIPKDTKKPTNSKYFVYELVG